MEDLLLHAGWLRRFAGALVKDPHAAQALVQDTLIAAWQRPAPKPSRPWLARVARNLAIDRWRSGDRRQRREDAATARDAGMASSPEQLVGNREIHRAIADAVTTLDEPFRQTLVLRFYDGMSSVEIARAFGVPEGTVRWRLKAGIERVRRSLDARYGQVRENWVAALLPLVPTAQAAPSAPPATQAVLTKMVEAVKAQSFDDFLTDASAGLKSQFTRQQFEGICGLYTVPLRKGYKLEYLGQLRQRQATVHLWKVAVTDGPDETLLRLILKDGKVDGFSVH